MPALTTKANPKLAALAAALILLPACGGGGGSSSKTPKTFQVTFEAPDGSGFAGGQTGGIQFKPLVTRNYELADGIVVSGQVLDGAGAPLEGVDVEFRPGSKALPVDDDSTDAGGNYSVLVGAGTWVVTLDSESSTLGTMTVSGVAVASPGPVTADFQFPATTAITGSVFEMGGPAIADAELEFEGAQTGAEVSVTCDGAGFYNATLVPDTYDVVVTPAGAAEDTHLRQRFRSVTVTGPMARDFSLTAGVQVSGVVLDGLGGPLLEETDIDIELPAGSDFFAPDDVTSSDVDGSYSIGPVPLGAVEFDLEAPGDSGFPRQLVAVQVTGPTAQPVDLPLEPGVVLSGTILEDDGLTGADAKVDPLPLDGSLEPDGDGTDGDGFYEISLFPGTYDVVIEPKDVDDMQLPEVRRITVTGATTLDVTLTRGVTVTGTVTQPGGVVVEPDVRVEIHGVLGASDVSDGGGTYSFLAPVGTHTLALTAKDGFFEDMALDDVTDVVVSAPGPVTQDIEMSLSLTGSTVVQGTVHEPDGVTPIAGVEIAARHSKTGEVLGRAVSGPGGEYVLVIP